MPYVKKEDLPEAVRNALPEHAQTIYQAAYNAAWEHYGKQAQAEARCAAIAWAAVKRAGYAKGEDGTWRMKSAEEMEAAAFEDAVELATREELHAQRETRAKKYGISPKEGGALTPPKGYPTDEDAFADPVNYAFPIDEDHIKPAESYFNHEGMREKGGYTPEEWAIIGKRIAAACTKYLGAKYQYKAGKIGRLAEASEPDVVAAGAGRIVTLHTLTEEDVAETASERISTVEVARVGTYMDAHGQEVQITEDALDSMVRNFEKGTAGQDVPVDVMHEKREAGGWLKRLWRKGKLLMAEVSWNGLGAQLVSDKVYRYLSASIALPDWVLRSVSLVNFPAIKGLTPVELSEWLLAQPYATAHTRGGPRAGDSRSTARQRKERDGGNSMADEEKDLREQDVDAGQAADRLAEFQAALEAGKDRIIAEMMEKITAELATKREEMLAQLAEQMADERELSEFVVDATAKGAHTLPVKPDELTAALRELPRPQRKQWMELLNKVAQAGTVDMRELGTAAEKKDDKRRLESDVARVAKQFVAGGGKIETFFQANPELGDPASYDLAEFGK
jgi:cation transport regulator ChaB